MKYITAIVNPYKLDDVRRSLSDVQIQGMTVSEVKGFGRQKGHKEIYRGSEYTVDFVPKCKIEIAVPEAQCDVAIRAISDAARNGRIGDGKIFVSNLEAAMRIRTGETDEEAL